MEERSRGQFFLTPTAKHNNEHTIVMPAVIDLTGRQVGKLKVIALTSPTYGTNGKPIRMYLCECECGKQRTVQGVHLLAGHTTSCGCSRADSIATHGHARRGPGGKTKTYQCWRNMIRRCYDPKNTHYKQYGQRGIVVCKRWLDSFENFLADMGECPGELTIDRFDNEGNYEPGNCKWATQTEQQNNRTNNRHETVRGVTDTVANLCRHFGIPYSDLVYSRLHRGWNLEDAFFILPGPPGCRY